MDTESGPDVASQVVKVISQETKDAQKSTSFWVVPLITAVVLAAVFCAYYFVYVGSRREYLANRNFRALALLGEELQQRISVHGNILEFCATLVKNKTRATDREKLDLNHFLLVHPEDEKLSQQDKEREALKDYLRFLAPTFELTEIDRDRSEPSNAPSKLRVERHNDRWELILTGFPHVTAETHEWTHRDFQGSLRIDELMEPLVDSLPFDDILLAAKDGTIVYQSRRSGPQFTTLSGLLQAQIGGEESGAAGKSGGEAEGREAPADAASTSQAGKQNGRVEQNGDRQGNAPVEQNGDPMWRTKSLHLTEVRLAGTRYKLFLQPVLVSSFSTAATREPASEWVLCGLRSSAALDWEPLSLSFTFFIWSTAFFFVFWTSYKVLKIFFMNQRERLRLRELAELGFSLVLLTSVITLSLLQLNLQLNNDTDARLSELGWQLSKNIHHELQQMSEQLTAWCSSKGPLYRDLKDVETNNKEIIRNDQSDDHPLVGKTIDRTPEPDAYPYVENGFWTDDDGDQIVKWSTTPYVTPMIDVSQLPIDIHPAAHLDGDPRAFNFTSILPPNKLEYLATFAMRTTDCAPAPDLKGTREDVAGGSAFLAAPPLSLVDPILPYGYGFALLDQTGLVIFHSDKTRNGRENFLIESDGSKELFAAIFAHSSSHSLPLSYQGRDYRALVVPMEGISQAPWSLIVYRDLTSVRTLDLQVMTVASTLLFLVLLGPAVIISIWCLIRRPQFAPEWLWPNPRRMATYVYQIFLYTLLVILFLLLGFRGSSEAILIACVAVPYATLLLTWWCFRVRPAPAGKPRGGKESVILSASPAGHYLAARLDRWLARRQIAEQSGGRPARGWFTYKNCYLVSVLLLLLLMGVLVPMALFRVSLNVERHLAIKQAQLHLASDLAQRWRRIVDQRENGELSEAAWCEFQAKTDCTTHQPQGNPWCWIVPVDLVRPGGKLPVFGHQEVARELYSSWFRRLLYSLHKDYNAASAEMLAVIPDRGKPPDWSWQNTESGVTLRWHGAYPEPWPSALKGDLLIASRVPAFRWSDAAIYLGIAIAVMLGIGGLFWALAHKVFLLDIAPLKITGAGQVTESLREGKNVMILLPPVSQWSLDAQKWTIDLAEVATSPKWAELLDLATIPMNTVIEVLHFEFSANDAEIDNQKFLLLQRLIQRGRNQLAVVMVAPVSSEDYHRTFPGLEVIDLREQPLAWLRQYEGPAQSLIWKECSPMPALWPLGAQLAKEITAESVFSKDTIASEMLERADPYYRLIWRECSKEQRFVLSQLAEDGLLNPTNRRTIRQLVRRGLITNDPQFRIVNESFRRFLGSATTPRLKQEWLQESRRSGWGKMHGAFFTTLTLLGVFLLATQSELGQSAAAYVATALGALGTLRKLSDTVRGRGSAEKAT